MNYFQSFFTKMQTRSYNLESKIDVLLIGGGVIGSVYAAQFALAGHLVNVLAHGSRDKALAANGIRLKDVVTQHLDTVPVTLVKNVSGKSFDIVIIAVQAKQLLSTFPVIQSLAGEPRLLFLGNNPDGHKLIPKDLPGTVQLGFPGIAGNINNGLVEYVHIAQQPTTLEVSHSPANQIIHSVLEAQGFKLQETATIDGWLAYHAVLISSISMALLRVDANADRLGRDPKLLSLMCRSIEEGYGMLKAQGNQGLPRNLAILHTPLLRPIAIHYWGSLMRSIKGELYFAGHLRHDQDEVKTLANWVLRQNQNKKTSEHLESLLSDA